jgi:hypothetical protein
MDAGPLKATVGGREAHPHEVRREGTGRTLLLASSIELVDPEPVGRKVARAESSVALGEVLLLTGNQTLHLVEGRNAPAGRNAFLGLAPKHPLGRLNLPVQAGHVVVDVGRVVRKTGHGLPLLGLVY